MDTELREFEEELGRLAPKALPEGVISRMALAMDRWQDDEREEKVVPFPAQGTPVRGGLWKAAAAVAILGAAVALVIPTDRPAEVAVADGTTARPALASPSRAGIGQVAYEPLSAARDIVSADSQGVVMMAQNLPHRCVRVEYMEHYEFEGEDGQALRVSKPAVGYILIPVRAD